jgi:hypothetical protein
MYEMHAFFVRRMDGGVLLPEVERLVRVQACSYMTKVQFRAGP